MSTRTLTASLKHLMLVAGLALAAPALGQDAKPVPTAPAATDAKSGKAIEPSVLIVGEKAPALNVGGWIKGAPIKEFEKGKLYVVEFWATWCGPCRVSIPHLTELAHKYKDKVTFVGVSVWENTDEVSEIKKFVEEMGDKMDYTVAHDTKSGNDGAMAHSWMEAARQDGIPTAFIVNGEGKVAWIGHPMELDAPLGQVVDGKYDLDAAVNKAKKEASGMAKAKALEAKFRDLMRAGKTDEAMGVADDLLAANPDRYLQLVVLKLNHLLVKKKDFDGASKWATGMIEGTLKDNAQALNAVAWQIVDPEANIEKRDVDVAIKAAARAVELTHSKDAAILDTLGACYWLKGDKAKAIEIQTQAVALAQGETKEELEERLKVYKGEKAAEKPGDDDMKK